MKEIKNLPVNDEDYEKLDYYNYYDLRALLFNGNIHKKELIDNLFLRTSFEEDIKELKNYLKENNEYIRYISEILLKKDNEYKVQLVRLFEPNLFDVVFDNYYKYVKTIIEDCKIKNYFDYNIYLTELTLVLKLTDDKKTIELIKEGIKILSDKFEMVAIKNDIDDEALSLSLEN